MMPLFELSLQNNDKQVKVYRGRIAFAKKLDQLPISDAEKIFS